MSFPGSRRALHRVLVYTLVVLEITACGGPGLDAGFDESGSESTVVALPASSPKQYFVSPTIGSNENPGTSPVAPLRTIAAASARAYPGDTVLLMDGVYSESIVPVRSGALGSPITYARYLDGAPTLDGQLNPKSDLAVLKDRSYIVIDGINFQNAKGAWVTLNAASTHNRVANGKFTTALGWSGFDVAGGSFNQFDYNTLAATCVGGSAPNLEAGVLHKGVGGPGNIFTFRGNAHHNIVEANRFGLAPHYDISLQHGQYNVVRNNRFANQWHAAIALFATVGPVVENVIEGNAVVDSGEMRLQNFCDGDGLRSWTWERNKFNGLQLDASATIVRRNRFINNGQTNMSTFVDMATFNRTYNNTYAFNYRSVYLWGEHDSSAHPYALVSNIWKNNIFYADREYSIVAPSRSGTLGRSGFWRNDFFQAPVQYRDVTGPYETVQAAYGDEWGWNLELDPQFVAPGSRDFHLKPTSELIDRGAFFTKVIGTARSRALRVVDSYYFTDGYGIVNGDRIQLEGSNETASVVGVDRTTHTLLLSNPLTFVDGQGVSLQYAGLRPDVGAFEFEP